MGRPGDILTDYFFIVVQRKPSNSLVVNFEPDYARALQRLTNLAGRADPEKLAEARNVLRGTDIPNHSPKLKSVRLSGLPAKLFTDLISYIDFDEMEDDGSQEFKTIARGDIN